MFNKGIYGHQLLLQSRPLIPSKLSPHEGNEDARSPDGPGGLPCLHLQYSIADQPTGSVARFDWKRQPSATTMVYTMERVTESCPARATPVACLETLGGSQPGGDYQSNWSVNRNQQSLETGAWMKCCVSLWSPILFGAFRFRSCLLGLSGGGLVSVESC